MKKSEFQSEWWKDGKNGPDCEIRAKSQRLVTGHMVSLCSSSHVSGHVQSQVVPSHGFILLDCGAVTPQWHHQLQGSRTILPVLF